MVPNTCLPRCKFIFSIFFYLRILHNHTDVSYIYLCACRVVLYSTSISWIFACVRWVLLNTHTHTCVLTCTCTNVLCSCACMCVIYRIKVRVCACVSFIGSKAAWGAGKGEHNSEGARQGAHRFSAQAHGQSRQICWPAPDRPGK